MAKFTNVHRQEVLVMKIQHGIYGCTYVRWAPKQWFYINEDNDFKVVNAFQDIAQLEKMYAAYVLEAVTKNNADVM